MEKLLIRLTLKHNESFHSYIGRTAEINCIPIKRLYILLGLARSKSKYVSFQMEDEKKLLQLSNLTGLSISVVKFMCSKIGEYALEENLHHLLTPIQRNKVKLCPECFKEDPYFRKEWNLAPITICPDHQCMLIDKCINCHDQISMNRLKFKQCNCGFGFENLPHVAVSVDDSLFSRFFYSRLYIKDSKYSHIAINNPLSNFNINELVKLILSIVKLLDIDGKTYTGHRLMSSKTSNIDIHIMMIKFVTLFNDWPNNFCSSLDVKKIDNDRIISQKHKLYMIMRSLDEISFDFIIKEIEDYISGSNRFRNLFSKSKKIVQMDSEWLSVSDTREILGGISDITLKKLIDQKNLEGVLEQIGKRKYLLIKRSSLMSYLELQFNLISMQDTMRFLNLSYFNCVVLLKRGLIEGDQKENKVYQIKKESITSFLSKLESKAKLPKKEDVLIPLEKSLKFLVNSSYIWKDKNSKITFADLIQQVLNNRLTLYYTEGRGMKKFCLASKELKNWFSLTMNSKIQEEGIPLPNVMTMLNLSRLDVKDFVNEGSLKIEWKTSQRILLNYETVRDFSSKLGCEYIQEKYFSALIPLKSVRKFLQLREKRDEKKYSFTNVISWILNAELTIFQIENSIHVGYFLVEEELEGLIRLQNSSL